MRTQNAAAVVATVATLSIPTAQRSWIAPCAAGTFSALVPARLSTQCRQ
jgi:hypothetical protein